MTTIMTNIMTFHYRNVKLNVMPFDLIRIFLENRVLLALIGSLVTDLFPQFEKQACPPRLSPPEADDGGRGYTPLADRMRPASLDEILGQDHLIGPGAPLKAA